MDGLLDLDDRFVFCVDASSQERSHSAAMRRNLAPRLNAKYFAGRDRSVGADGNPPAKDCEAPF